MAKCVVNEYFMKNSKSIYEILCFSMKNVEHYRGNFKFNMPAYEDFNYDFFNTQVPILEKKNIKKDSSLLLSDYVDFGNLILETTSGTEGIPLNCYKAKKDLLNCTVDLWKMRRKVIKDLTPKDRFVHFYVSRKKEKETVTDRILYDNNVLHLPLFNLSEDVLIGYWKEILKFKPRWMHGIASTIYNLALVIKMFDLTRIKIELIELTGEYLESDRVELIKEVFNCKVANQYGAREFWLLAYGCEYNKLHLNSNSVFIEEYYSEIYQKTELLVTSFKNYTWPLIRYRLGDTGEIKRNNCKCDFGGDFLLVLQNGRTSEYCQFGDVKISKVLFSYISRIINKKGRIVEQYQVIKEHENSILIKIIGNLDYKNMIEEVYKEELHKRLKDIKIRVEFTSLILPDVKTGKVKEFIDTRKEE